MKETNDPLEILIAPHEVVVWMRKHFIETKKREPKEGFSIYHGKIKLTGFFNTQQEAMMKIEEIIGDKKKCWENKRIYKIRIWCKTQRDIRHSYT